MRISDWSSDVCSSDLQTEDKRDDILLGLLDGQNQLNRRIVDLEVEIRKTKIERSAGILSLAPSNFGGLLGGSVQMPTSKRSREGALAKALFEFESEADSDKDRKSTRLNSSH